MAFTQGLIALLAAVDALSNIGSLDKLQKQVCLLFSYVQCAHVCMHARRVVQGLASVRPFPFLIRAKLYAFFSFDLPYILEISCLLHFCFLIWAILQLVFAVFTGEAWGYLGSRRFLHELDIGTDGLKGLNGTLIEQASLLLNSKLVNKNRVYYILSWLLLVTRLCFWRFWLFLSSTCLNSFSFFFLNMVIIHISENYATNSMLVGFCN